MADSIKAKLVVLHDAYLTTFRDEVRVARGNYLDVNSDATCRVCLLGALFVGNILGSSAKIPPSLNSVTSRGMVAHLETIFDPETLAIAEALFEGGPIYNGPYKAFWIRSAGKVDLADALSTEHIDGDSVSRARFILQHLIENEGKIDLSSYHAGRADFSKHFLSPKALDVLNRHGVPSAAVETPCG